MQAYPKRNKVVGKLVRPLIIPDPGMILEEADAWQQEPRLFTHYSQEPALLEGYNSGTMDMHDRANEILFGNADRDRAKRLGLGMLTMMSPPTLAGHMRCTLQQARIWHRAFLDDAFPMIKEFQQQAVRVYKERGFVKSILGRRARMESVKFAYQAVSRIIQNSAGDHLKTCLLRAMQYEDAHPEVQVLLTIHDSLIWQRDPGHHPRELVRVLENVPHEPQFNLSVPIPFEVGGGAHWGEASYGPKIKEKLVWHS
jgi:DNA polymerase-1